MYNKTKAQAQYHVNRREAERKLENLRRMINAHRVNAGDGLNYGHVGDLAYLNEQLDKMVKFLDG